MVMVVLVVSGDGYGGGGSCHSLTMTILGSFPWPHVSLGKIHLHTIRERREAGRNLGGYSQTDLVEVQA